MELFLGQFISIDCLGKVDGTGRGWVGSNEFKAKFL